MELAQVNVSRMRAPFDDPLMSGFVALFDPLIRSAETSPGFSRRLHEHGTGHAVVEDPQDGLLAVNVSVWTGYPALHKFVYHGAHGRLLAAARDRWFLPTPQPSTALWWVPDGHRPDLADAMNRLARLRRYGPSRSAFGLLHQYAPDGTPVPRTRRRPR